MFLALLKDVLGSDMQHCKLFVLGECVSECFREIAVKMLVGFYMFVVCFGSVEFFLPFLCVRTSHVCK